MREKELPTQGIHMVTLLPVLLYPAVTLLGQDFSF